MVWNHEFSNLDTFWRSSAVFLKIWFYKTIFWPPNSSKMNENQLFMQLIAYKSASTTANPCHWVLMELTLGHLEYSWICPPWEVCRNEQSETKNSWTIRILKLKLCWMLGICKSFYPEKTELNYPWWFKRYGGGGCFANPILGMGVGVCWAAG